MNITSSTLSVLCNTEVITKLSLWGPALGNLHHKQTKCNNKLMYLIKVDDSGKWNIVDNAYNRDTWLYIKYKRISVYE